MISSSPQHIKSISAKLEKVYGKKKWMVYSDPLSDLIATILSQNTSDHNSHRAYSGLRLKFKNWDEVRKADVRRIAGAIRSGGLADVKAKRIKDILRQIHAEKGYLDLNFLKRWRTEKIKEYLGKFKGVGEKTIACVLLFSLKRPVLPVDTHVLRVSIRLGLVPEKTDAAKAQLILERLVPPGLVYQFHLNLIEHGRKTCKAANPICGECVLLDNCPYGKMKLKR
ncbi:MAG: endonuclease III [Candidatus Zixiibacteriota bacterium]